MNRCVFLLAIVITALPGQVFGDDAAKAPATQPAGALLSVSDAAAMKANVGKDIAVEAKVSTAMWSATGKVFLIKFADAKATQFQAAIFLKSKEAMVKAFNGDLSNAFEGSKIRLTGRLQLYREHPEVQVAEPSQITILEKGPGNSPHAATQPAAAK